MQKYNAAAQIFVSFVDKYSKNRANYIKMTKKW